MALGFKRSCFGVSAHVDTSKLAIVFAKAIFTAMSPNPLPEIDKVHLKFAACAVFNTHIAVWQVMTPYCSLYPAL